MKLAVGIPWQQEMMWSSFLFDFWQTDVPRDARLIRGDKKDTPMSRNHIVREALGWGADELLFMDIDQTFPSDVLARLRSHKKDIVSGWTPLRKQPHWPLVYLREGKSYRPLMPEGELQKVDGFGFGCVLIKMHVFERMVQPWFEQEFHDDESEKAGGLKVGHDLNWCRKAQEAGFELWVDNTVECGHLMNVMIDREYAMNGYIEMMAEHKARQIVQKESERRIHVAGR